MDNNAIVELIKRRKGEGESKESIYQNLISQGYSISDIQKGFDALEAGHLPQSSQTLQQEVKKHSVNVVVTFGALMIGIGVFAFIASNWKGIGSTLKVFIILTSMLTAYGSGWYLKEFKGYSKIGSALVFLGVLIYGGGIFLVGQIFNIRAEWVDGIVLWMIGMVALLYVEESVIIMYLSVLLGFLSLNGYLSELSDPYKGSPANLFPSFMMTFIASIVFLFMGNSMHKKIQSSLDKG